MKAICNSDSRHVRLSSQQYSADDRLKSLIIAAHVTLPAVVSTVLSTYSSLMLVGSSFVNSYWVARLAGFSRSYCTQKCPPRNTILQLSTPIHRPRSFKLPTRKIFTCGIAMLSMLIMAILHIAIMYNKDVWTSKQYDRLSQQKLGFLYSTGWKHHYASKILFIK